MASNKGIIELELHDPNQLFNSMDPSPFHDKDLDGDAEEFIVNWAREFPIRQPLTLVIHLEHMPDRDPTPLMQESVQNFFAYRLRMNRLEFNRLMAEGRLSLAVGLAFLAACFAVANLVLEKAVWPGAGFVRESLTIAGWVAMWRPVQIYLHDWWPLLRRGRVYAKLSRMPVQVIQKRIERPGR